MFEADRDPLALISMAIRDSERAIIGAGVLDRSGQFLDKNLGPRCAIVSDTNIAPHFGERLTKILKAAGFDVTFFASPPMTDLDLVREHLAGSADAFRRSNGDA